jgi:hypothetical protein
MSSILKFFKPANENTATVPSAVDLNKSSVDSPPMKRQKLEMSHSGANRNVSSTNVYNI